MAEDILYTHHESGRRPLTWGFALFSAAVAGVGLWNGAPWYWWLPVGGACIALGWVLAVNRPSGSVLTTATLRFYRGTLDRTVALADVERFERQAWAEGPDDVTLILRGGERVPLPLHSIDHGFVAALQRAGVKMA